MEDFEPLYKTAKYDEENRQITKFLGKQNWFSQKKKKIGGWRGKLEGVWKGPAPLQRPVKGLKYTTVLQVPNSNNAALVKELARLEPKLAKLTKYSVKLVEKSGIPLARLFNRTFDESNCHWQDCPVCLYSDKKGSKCRQNNVVYESTCLRCESQIKQGVRQEDKLGKYIGETSRCLAERSREHVQLLKILMKGASCLNTGR